MASDRKQFREALGKWESLQEKQRFSLPKDMGATAIMHAVATTGDTDEVRAKELAAFEQEAYDFANKIDYTGREARIIRGISNRAFCRQVLLDKEVSNVIVIGHGNFSNILTDKWRKIDWKDVSYMADHLKTGFFMQRFCGNYMRNLSVPFSLFAVSDPRQITAPRGTAFSPEINPDDEKLIKPVTVQEKLGYDDIKRLFPLHPTYKPMSESAVVENETT